MILQLVLGALAIGAAGEATASGAPIESAATAGCRPYAGLEQLWSNRKLRWIVVGEQHGTWEMPGAFRDIVCNAAAAKRPILVALERPESEQADIDAYVRSEGGPDAEAALLRNLIGTINGCRTDAAAALICT